MAAAVAPPRVISAVVATHAFALQVRDVYEAFVIHCFLVLMLDFPGGEQKVTEGLLARKDQAGYTSCMAFCLHEMIWVYIACAAQAPLALLLPAPHAPRPHVDSVDEARHASVRSLSLTGQAITSADPLLGVQIRDPKTTDGINIAHPHVCWLL